jgi:hypothetical protein
VDSIGVNGQAVTFETGESGILVASVQAGSPADKAGVEGGDIILQLAGLPLATDGTMADYCDILRSHSPEATLDVQVVRLETTEVWEGQLNGRELERAFSFGRAGQGDVNQGAGDQTYENYVRVSDDLAAIEVEVPVEWAEIDGSPWTDDDGQTFAAMLQAAPNLADLLFGGSGLLFMAWRSDEAFDAGEWLDLFEFSQECASYEGRSDYADLLYSGNYDYYTGCENDSIIFVVVAAPEDETYITIVIVQALTAADLDAADHVFDTFEVVGELPEPSGPSGAAATLDVVNQSEETIFELNISPSTSDSWGDDVLGDLVIRPGESHTITDIAPDKYDIRPLDAEGNSLGILYTVDLTGEHTLTVTGMATLPPNAELRFEDDFSDNRHNWGGDGDTDDVTYYPPQDGEFCMLIKTDYLIGWEWYEPFETDEFFAEVMCTLQDPNSECGLGFGPDGDNLFWFKVHPSEQRFGIDVLQNDEWQDDLIEWTQSYYIDPTSYNYLALGRVGSQVSAYVNGILVGQADSDLFPTGRIGIGGGTQSVGNLLVCLDDLSVWQLK